MAASIILKKVPPLPTVRDLLKLYNLRAKKNLSQNFLLDQRICSKFVKAAGKLKDAYVCEIGPGPGNISRAILERSVRNLTVIEKDERFKPTLEMLAEAVNGPMNILWGDILEYNLEGIFPEDLKKDWDDPTPPLHIIGNLPFGVSTPLIIRWLRQVSARSGPFYYGRSRLTLTFQAEVAERLFVDTGNEQRSRLSIMAQYLCDVDYKFVIPGSAFVPAPDIDVGVVTLNPLKTPLINHNFDLVEKVVKAIFYFRQKYCIKGLRLLFPEPDTGCEMMSNAGVNPRTRPFNLSMEEISRICDAYKEIIDKNPKFAGYDYRL